MRCRVTFIIESKKVDERLFAIKSLAERPLLEKAPSILAIMGSISFFVFIFDILEKSSIGAGRRNSINGCNWHSQILKNKYMQYQFEGIRFDVGKKLGFIETTLEFALQREDIKCAYIEYMHYLIQKNSIVKS